MITFCLSDRRRRQKSSLREKLRFSLTSRDMSIKTTSTTNMATEEMDKFSFDELLSNLDAIKSGSAEEGSNDDLAGLVAAYQSGDYKSVLEGTFAQAIFEKASESGSVTDIEPLEGDVVGSWTYNVLSRLLSSTYSVAHESVSGQNSSDDTAAALRSRARHIRTCALILGLAAFDAFLQANVTGPPLNFSPVKALVKDQDTSAVRQRCLDSLAMDGISVYQYIPNVELFCLARTIFCDYFPRTSGLKKAGSGYDIPAVPESFKTSAAEIPHGSQYDTKWMRIRVNAYHQRLLTGVKLSDSPSVLQVQIEADLAALEKELFSDDSSYTTEAKVQFLLERAQIYIMQGMDLKAKSNVERAKEVSKFSYALTGALGKKTKFQEKDTSQLVVFAKSHTTPEVKDADKTADSNGLIVATSADIEAPDSSAKVPATLDLNDDTLLESIAFTKTDSSGETDLFLPKELAGLKPDEQPQLQPLDQIILLTEATLKDTLSPLDKLNREEILPFAVRVLTDKPSNWQVYTQALLVRSRIESHRSRTQERSVLQLQAIVDQIIADTENEESSANAADGVPQIQVTQFFPRAKANESAPVTERLKYIFQLNTPTRWEVESELAFAWSNAGSLVTALEIFKRLRLWAEVALCYHSVHQEDRARQIVRRQLFHSANGPEMDNYDIDAPELLKEQWEGEMRSPPPAHAPRLWCILGDLEQNPEYWQRAWEISKNRFARAQRTLGEYYTRQGDLSQARDAYLKATVVNRQNEETWSRLGDIDLRGGNWDGAIIAFQQSIMIDDTDAKTYSNLGSALLSKYSEMMQLEKISKEAGKSVNVDEDDFIQEKTQSPKDVLRQALIAYKRGASIAYDNWKIWDNVITIAGRLSPPSYPEILQGMRNVIRIRGPTVGEEAVDADILRALINQLSALGRPDNVANFGDIYMPARGTLARAVIEMVDADIIPLITARAELWALVEKLALFRRDYEGALECATKAWRMATAGEEWLKDKLAWKAAANATDALASALESYGPMERRGADDEDDVVEKGWKLKAKQAVRGMLGKARDVWEGTEEYIMLEEKMEELKAM
jgi:tetratricopeptide (TPR) repeat protein